MGKTCGFDSSLKHNKQLARTGFHMVVAAKMDEEIRRNSTIDEIKRQLSLLKHQGHDELNLT